MYHYSYVFPDQVYKKVNYYKDSVSKQNCIDDYFYKIYYPWITGNNNQKKLIEDKFLGVHEFLPSVRGDCYTAPFALSHPESINKSISDLNSKISNQIEKYKK